MDRREHRADRRVEGRHTGPGRRRGGAPLQAEVPRRRRPAPPFRRGVRHPRVVADDPLPEPRRAGEGEGGRLRARRGPGHRRLPPAGRRRARGPRLGRPPRPGRRGRRRRPARGPRPQGGADREARGLRHDGLVRPGPRLPRPADLEGPARRRADSHGGNHPSPRDAAERVGGLRLEGAPLRVAPLGGGRKRRRPSRGRQAPLRRPAPSAPPASTWRIRPRGSRG